jgi:hypothetical protein
VLALLASPLVSRAEAFEVSPGLSPDGVYQLKWPPRGPVVLEESRDRAFDDAVVVYRGRDHATTLTGRPDGTYFYRLRPDGSATGASLETSVTVSHHSLPRALGFFAVGLGVFVATVALVVRGADPDERPAGSPGGGSRV